MNILDPTRKVFLRATYRRRGRDPILKMGAISNQKNFK